MVDWIVWFFQLRIVSVVLMFWCGFESGRLFEVRRLSARYGELIDLARQLDKSSETISRSDGESDLAA